MKQLFVDHKATTIFFEDDVHIEKIKDWVREQINFKNGLKFGLNEPHSCSVTSEVVERNKNKFEVITISGDEDLLEMVLETIIPIKL